MLYMADDLCLTAQNVAKPAMASCVAGFSFPGGRNVSNALNVFTSAQHVVSPPPGKHGERADPIPIEVCCSATGVHDRISVGRANRRPAPRAIRQPEQTPTDFARQ